MAAARRVLVALVLGSALVARPAAAQHGSSVSLTHTLTVTVPPRVKVQIVAPAAAAAASVSNAHSTALEVSVSATQSWILSIGSAKQTGIQWSKALGSGYSNLGQHEVTIASGKMSQLPAASNLFFRDAAATSASDRSGVEGSDPVILTVIAP
ncbi:MAG TPA: hypothetical protein VGG76_05810 [Gemmatimonadaceae bacterium]